MNTKVKLIATAVGLALANSAHALVQPQSGDSALLFSAWDSVNQVAFSAVVGSEKLSTFAVVSGATPAVVTILPGATALLTSQTWDFSADVNFSAFAEAKSSWANVKWNVSAHDYNAASPPSGGANAKGVLNNVFTLKEGNSLGSLTLNGNTNSGVASNAQTYFNALNTLSGSAQSFFTSAADGQAYAGSWGSTFGLASSTGLNNTGDVFGTNGGLNDELSFWFLTAGDSTSPYGATIAAFRDELVEGAKWTFKDNGTLSYVVPIPAAAWLLAGALGLMGMMRRRTV